MNNLYSGVVSLEDTLSGRFVVAEHPIFGLPMEIFVHVFG